ncbi:MAG: hypothetical protein AABX96_01930 [Nanoarchaeota archaeon]
MARITRPKTLDMSKADGQAITEFDLVKRDLEKKGKYRPDLLYRGFDGTYMKTLLETGRDTESGHLFCATEEQVNRNRQSGENSFDYAFTEEIPALAVYNPDCLIETNPHAYEYKLKKGKELEAVVAVYLLKYNRSNL